MIQDKNISSKSGYQQIIFGIVLLAISVGCLIFTVRMQNPWLIIAVVTTLLASILLLAGLFMINPNEPVVLQLFGKYKGTTRDSGLKWANPFYSKLKISTKVRNFETTKMKVNDSHSNPVEIASVVVWQVVDCAEAFFEVDNYEDYVHVQSEAAVRNLTTQFPYDASQGEPVSLSGNTAEVSDRLKEEIQNRLKKAGVMVLEARISHLAYAQEIAAAMLQRQQAAAVVAARQQIVEGAVGMVDMALKHLDKDNIVSLDEERKASMVSNLLVVLCSDRAAHPVINAGSLY
jgi:regulator of protease activity HflC (stomatin/prohibitin superfamily)